MADVSIFNIGGQDINVKDATARTAAATASTTANAAQTAAAAAQTTANSALKLAQDIEDLSRVTIDYIAASETIQITTTDHK